MIHYAEPTKQLRAGKNVSKAQPTIYGWDIRQVRSHSNPNKFYRVDVTNGRCDCPAWKFQKGGIRKPCKHLLQLGFQMILQPGGEIALPAQQSTKQKVKVTA